MRRALTLEQRKKLNERVLRFKLQEGQQAPASLSLGQDAAGASIVARGWLPPRLTTADRPTTEKRLSEISEELRGRIEEKRQLLHNTRKMQLAIANQLRFEIQRGERQIRDEIARELLSTATNGELLPTPLQKQLSNKIDEERQEVLFEIQRGERELQDKIAREEEQLSAEINEELSNQINQEQQQLFDAILREEQLLRNEIDHHYKQLRYGIDAYGKLLLVLKVELGDGKTGTIEVFQGQNLRELVLDFCAEHALDAGKVADALEKLLQSKLAQLAQLQAVEAQKRAERAERERAERERAENERERNKRFRSLPSVVTWRLFERAEREHSKKERDKRFRSRPSVVTWHLHPPKSLRVRVSGVRLHLPDKSLLWRGVNGVYVRSNEMFNGQPVYSRLSTPWAIWLTNVAQVLTCFTGTKVLADWYQRTNTDT